MNSSSIQTDRTNTRLQDKWKWSEEVNEEKHSATQITYRQTEQLSKTVHPKRKFLQTAGQKEK